MQIYTFTRTLPKSRDTSIIVVIAEDETQARKFARSKSKEFQALSHLFTMRIEGEVKPGHAFRVLIRGTDAAVKIINPSE